MNALPPTKLDLENFKRVYMNAKNKVAEACEGPEGLYKVFEPENWSLFFARYKYADELTTPMWQTANLLRGTYQRMGEGLKLNKYSFAHMAIHQKPGCPHHEMSGFWLIRGDGLPELMKEGDDWEIFEWTRINWAEIDQHKEKINAYMNIGNDCCNFMGDEVEDWNTFL
jgi:hypothetical protein